MDLLADGFGFLEGPQWHDGRLWVSDITQSEVLSIGMDGAVQIVAKVENHPCGLAFLPDATLLVASMHDRIIYRIKSGCLCVYSDLSKIEPKMLNDITADANGRLYVGSIGFDPFAGERPCAGGLIMVESGGKARMVAEDLMFPNTSVITTANRLVIGETLARRMTSFDIRADGTLQNRQVAFDLPFEPDGCCLDAEGGLWIAAFKDERFVRIKDDEIVQSVPTPGRIAVACQIGGPDGHTLFGLTVRGSVEDLMTRKRARIETLFVKTPAPGFA